MACWPNANVRFKVCKVLFFAIFAIQIAGVNTDYWEVMVVGERAFNRGLFKDCWMNSEDSPGNDTGGDTPVPGGYHCNPKEGHPSWLVAVQAMEVIGSVGLVLIGVAFSRYGYTVATESPYRMYSIGWIISTGLFILTGILIYAGHKSPNSNLGYSFGLCVVSLIGTVVCAVLLIIESIYYKRLETHVPSVEPSLFDPPPSYSTLSERAPGSRTNVQSVGTVNAGLVNDVAEVTSSHPVPSTPSESDPSLSDPPPSYSSLSELATVSRTNVLSVDETCRPLSPDNAEDANEVPEVTSITPVPSAPPEPEPSSSDQPPSYSSLSTPPPPSYEVLQSQGLI